MSKHESRHRCGSHSSQQQQQPLEKGGAVAGAVKGDGQAQTHNEIHSLLFKIILKVLSWEKRCSGNNGPTDKDSTRLSLSVVLK